MKPSIFLNDMLTKGAIIGALVLAANVAEISMIYYGGVQYVLLAGFVAITLFGLYCYLVYRFTKSYANLVLSARKEVPYFTYGNGLAYVVSISMLSGVIVGLGEYVLLHNIIGYENYIDFYVKLLQDALTQAQLPASMAGTYDQLFKTIQSQEEPSLFATILSGVWTYLVVGTIVGLVVAAFTRRSPQIFDKNESESNE